MKRREYNEIVPTDFEFIKIDFILTVKEAGRVAVGLRERGVSVRVKSSKRKSFDQRYLDIVTEADYLVGDMLTKRLKSLYPQILFIAEESGLKTCDDLSKIKLTAVIDPIDGTREFFAGQSGNWAISIGFVEKKDLVAGVVYQPEKKLLYLAEKGRGAFLNGEKIKVSSTSSIIGAKAMFDYPYETDKREYRLMVRLKDEVAKKLKLEKLERLGSQVVAISQVAEGAADFFFAVKVKPWDVAGPLSVIQEAGGDYFDIVGKEYNLFDEKILITNGRIDAAPFVEIVKKML